MKEFKVVPIRNGTVLDHLDAGTSLRVLEALGLPTEGSAKVVSLSMNLPTRGDALKDILKLEDLELSAEDLAKVQAVSGRGTHVVIRGYDIVQKTSWPS